jgi:hypothetical protein
VIPDSLEVMLHPDPKDDTDDTPHISVIQPATTITALEDGRQENSTLHLRSTCSSPINVQMLAREHQTDERRVEMLTQVGRRALNDQAEELLCTPPTQNDSTNTPIPYDLPFKQCQSKTAVSPVVLQNLGTKRSRPRRPAEPSDTSAKASANEVAPSVSEYDQNQNLLDLPSIENAIEACDSSPPKATEAAVPEPVSAYPLPHQNPLSKGTSSVLLSRTTPPRRQRSPLVIRRPGDSDRMGRPVAAASPLGRFDQQTTLRRLGFSRSPLEPRDMSTKKELHGRDDMYLTFGLMIKAKEREELLEEKAWLTIGFTRSRLSDIFQY